MKIKLKNKKNKFIINLIMIAGLIGCLVSTVIFEKGGRVRNHGTGFSEMFKWGTSHCIISLVLVVFILIHIWQHWGYIKTVIRKKLYWKNKILTLTSVLFMITISSIILYLFGFDGVHRHYHSLVTHLFVLITIVHFILNFKKLIRLIKAKQCN